MKAGLADLSRAVSIAEQFSGHKYWGWGGESYDAYHVQTLPAHGPQEGFLIPRV